MAQAVQVAGAAPATCRRRRAPGRPALVLALVALPLLVAIAGLIGRSYVPTGDEASIIYRAGQVGGAHTPLVGTYSTRGWAHPGPALFYLLAVPYRLSGARPIATFVGAALLNMGSVLLACYLAWRRRRWPGLLIVAAFTATLLYGLGPARLVEIWNPHLPLLAYFAFCLALWCVAERDWAQGPVAALLGTAVAQTHVGYVPLVAAGGLTLGVAGPAA